MSEMVERVARRLIELEEGDPDGPTSIPDRPARWMLMIEDAQSIIALLREPTAAMMVAAAAQHTAAGACATDYGYTADADQMGEIWHAMVDAALVSERGAEE